MSGPGDDSIEEKSRLIPLVSKSLLSPRIEKCLRGKGIKKRTALLYLRTRLEFGII